MVKALTACLALAATLLAGCATAPADTAGDPAAAAAKDAPKAAAAGPIFTLPSLQKELDNGLRVIVVKAPFKDTVSVHIPVQTGSRNEVEPGKTGFAHFFEHMMFRGTPKYPADAYSATIKAAGADQNAYTDDDLTNYYTNITTADLDKVLEVEADRFKHLAYSEEQFRTEALAVKGEYLKNFANPLLKGFERLADQAYTTHTYKHITMGLLEDIEQMPNQMEYAKTFFERWYRPEYTTVIVVGDVELEPTFELVKKHFGDWQRGSYTVEIPVEPAPQGPRHEHVKWEGPTLPWLLAAWRGPGFDPDSTDMPALNLMGEMYFGPTSDLYQQVVVKERWADQFFYSPSNNRDPGLFTVGIRLTDAAHADKVVAAVEAALLAARTQVVADATLAEVKSRVKYGFTAGMDSAASIAGILARYVHYERDLQTLNRAFQAFDRVTPAEVHAVANAVFFDANRTVVSISNDAALEGAKFKGIDAQVAARGASPSPAKAAATPAAVVTVDDGTDAWAAGQAENLLPVIEQRSDTPLVDVSLLFATGASDDPPGKKGLAALTAAMLSEGGTAKRSYEEIEDAFYPLASGLEAQVDKDMTRLSGTVHRDNFAAWRAIVREILTEPGFREDDFKRLQQQQLNAIRVSLRGNNDEELAKEVLYENIYGPGHPYGTLNLGHAKQVEALTLQDVRDFYQSYYRVQRLTVGLAGGYDDAMRAAVLSDTMRLPQEQPGKRVVEPAAMPKARAATVVQKEASSVAVSMGFPLTIRRGDPDWLALWLVRSWLGEHRNSNARLYNQIRETRGMNYGDYAYVEYFPNGMYLMQPEPNYARKNDLFQVWLRPLRSNDDALFATRAALYELDQLVKNGLGAEGFEATRNFLKKQVALLTASQSRQLGYALDSRYYETPDFVEYVRTGLDALTLAQVDAAIRKHFRLDAMQFVFIAKDAEDLAKKLRAGTASPITYNTPKPEALLAEDRLLAKYPLGLKSDAVKVVKADTLFE